MQQRYIKAREASRYRCDAAYNRKLYHAAEKPVVHSRDASKKVFVLFGQKNAVARAVKNLTVVNRNTRLGSRISEDAGFLLEKQNAKKHERKTA